MLIAFQEVEDNLALERYQVQRIERLNTQVELAGQASSRLSEFYITQDATFLDILSSIQAQQRLQRETLSARLDLILIRIGLYLALAGDFDLNSGLTRDVPVDLPSVLQNPAAEGPDAPADPPELPSGPTERVPPLEPAPETNLDE